MQLLSLLRNRYLLAGGKPQARDTYVYDFHLRTWFDAGLLSESREGAACGAVDMKSGGEGGASVQVVVAGDAAQSA